MTKEEAKWVVEQCRGWNTSQTSVSLAMKGKRTAEDDVLDQKRKTLLKAWEILYDD